MNRKCESVSFVSSVPSVSLQLPLTKSKKDFSTKNIFTFMDHFELLCSVKGEIFNAEMNSGKLHLP